MTINTSRGRVITEARRAAAVDVDAALKNCEKLYGVGAVMRLDDSSTMDVDVVPTGIASLDYDVLKVGGIPLGRIVEVFGPEAAGKTSLCSEIVAAFQRAGFIAAFIDAEHAYDPEYARLLGVDTSKLLVSQPDNGEQALEITETLCESGVVGIIVVDSVAALVPKAEIDGTLTDNKAGLGSHARLMSSALRRLSGVAKRNNVTIVFINQIRHKIGVTFGSSETTTGGRALRFYASVRLDIRRIGAIKASAAKDAEIVGSRVRIKAVKLKVAPPFGKCELDLRFAFGLDAVGDIFDMAVASEAVEQSGAWYSFEGERLGQGREKVLAMLRESDELVNLIKAAL